MLSIKPVLPNFLKILTVAIFACGSISAFADGHGDHKKVGDLKDMGADATKQVEEAAIPELSDLDAASEEIMVEDLGADTKDSMQELKEKASSLAEE